VITTAVGLSANFASFFLIETKKIGRWGLLFIGLIVMDLCMRESRTTVNLVVKV
jgi:hypothetical protein